MEKLNEIQRRNMLINGIILLCKRIAIMALFIFVIFGIGSMII